MLINLNGWPGVGKLTTACELQKLLGGKVLDNHTILNVGKALAEGGTPEYYTVARAVRSVAFDAILKLPSTLPIIFTSVVARGGTSGFLEENWQALISLAQMRNCPLFSVMLTCSPDENTRRIVAEDRGFRQKKRDPRLLTELIATRSLIDDGATFRTIIDNTALTAPETARQIHEWISGLSCREMPAFSRAERPRTLRMINYNRFWVCGGFPSIRTNDASFMGFQQAV